MDYRIAFLAGLIYGDGNLYIYPDGRRRYVRIYTPDVSEVVWTAKVSREVFGKYPIIGLDKPRRNKRLYVFRLELHDRKSYDLFSRIDLAKMSYHELIGFLSGIIYAEGHIKTRRKGKRILFDALEIEMKKDPSIKLLIRVCNLLNINIRFYRRLKRGHKVYYIRDQYLVEKLMDIEHINWKWIKLLASLNKVDLCTYALTKLYDHVILNDIIGKFFSGKPLSEKEISLLNKMIDLESTARTRASILGTSPINQLMTS